MKQVVQNLRSGVLELLEVPCPQARPGHLLIQGRASLISSGTERSLVEFGQASLMSKARQNPDRVRQVLDKIRTDGLLPTLEAVFDRLDEPLPLGYCHAGVVVEVGQGVEGYRPGDRVASNGHHAELVCVPKHLAARIPQGVPDEHAAFAVLGAISLQGVRLVQPELGETVVVFGLGLVGLLAVQLLAASGARVIGIDTDPARLALARSFGAQTIHAAEGQDTVAAATSLTGGMGVDAVLVAASARNDSIISQAARMSRKRGRIILVGVVNLELNRAEFYEKELRFQVSCSYGPGRYDSDYEERGIDYPQPFVRWTEQRNIEAVLAMIAAGRLNVAPLITSRVPHADAGRAYDLLSKDRSQLGIVLEYPASSPALDRVVPAATTATAPAKKPRTIAKPVSVGVIGAGAFTKRMLLPALVRTGAKLVSIASAKGVSGAHAARKFGFATTTTDYRTILDDPQINTVFITTRHNQHAPMVIAALAAGKHVFVEKPLAIDAAGLDAVREAFSRTTGLQLMVGFNRRFVLHIVRMRSLLGGRQEPLAMSMLVNAGRLPDDHWQHDRAVGGGRMIGEGCHFVDLLSYVADSPIVDVTALTAGNRSSAAARGDVIAVSLRMADGSIATLEYLANGHRAFPKEKLEVFSDGRVLELDNFRRMWGYGWSNFRRMKLWGQDKGHGAEIEAFVRAIAEGGPPLIPPESLWNVTAATFAVEESAATGNRVCVAPACAAQPANS